MEAAQSRGRSWMQDSGEEPRGNVWDDRAGLGRAAVCRTRERSRTPKSTTNRSHTFLILPKFTRGWGRVSEIMSTLLCSPGCKNVKPHL